MDRIDTPRAQIRAEITRTPALGKESVNQVPVAQQFGDPVSVLSVEQKRALAADFFLTGNLSAIARERGILYNDLLEMAREPWFQDEIRNLEREANALLKVKLTKMLGSALDALEDRLENGDEKWVKGRGLTKIPVSARDLAVIGTALFDKKRAIEESEIGLGSSEARRLLGLADALRARGIAAQPPEVLEGEIVREAGDAATDGATDEG